MFIALCAATAITFRLSWATTIPVVQDPINAGITAVRIDDDDDTAYMFGVSFLDSENVVYEDGKCSPNIACPPHPNVEPGTPRKIRLVRSYDRLSSGQLSSEFSFDSRTTSHEDFANVAGIIALGPRSSFIGDNVIVVQNANILYGESETDATMRKGLAVNLSPRRKMVDVNHVAIPIVDDERDGWVIKAEVGVLGYYKDETERELVIDPTVDYIGVPRFLLDAIERRLDGNGIAVQLTPSDELYLPCGMESPMLHIEVKFMVRKTVLDIPIINRDPSAIRTLYGEQMCRTYLRTVHGSHYVLGSPLLNGGKSLVLDARSRQVIITSENLNDSDDHSSPSLFVPKFDHIPMFGVPSINYDVTTETTLINFPPSDAPSGGYLLIGEPPNFALPETSLAFAFQGRREKAIESFSRPLPGYYLVSGWELNEDTSSIRVHLAPAKTSSLLRSTNETPLFRVSLDVDNQLIKLNFHAVNRDDGPK